MSSHVPRTFPRLSVRPYVSCSGPRRYGIYLARNRTDTERLLCSRDEHADAMTVAQRLAAHMFDPGRLS